jgi:outer membrane receptor protein involved in Fe transport
MRQFWIVTACVLALAASTAHAQQGTASIRGTVTDEQGAVLPGVTVVATEEDTGNFREASSNADGSYFLSGIRPGRYKVSAELTGFKAFTIEGMVVGVGQTQAVDVRLAVGGITEAVTVTGQSPLLDLTSKEVGGNITSRDLVDLPSVNRNFVGFVGLLPGIVANISNESFGSDSVSVNGQDSRYNNYLLDGANNNDDVIGQRAGTQARTPIESIQEFQVLTGQFDAEYGRTTGAVINAVTKQGTNQFRGSAFGFFQDASLTKRDYFAEKGNLAKPDTKQQQFGGTLGGPILKSKAHFFVSLERVLIDDGVTINVPARPDLNDTTTEKTRVWNTVTRFDNQLNANHTWGVRWLRESSPQFNQIIGTAARAATLAAAREEADVDQTVVGTLSSVLGNNRVNTMRVAFTREDVAFANPGFNGNGQNQAALPPTLDYLTYTAQQSNVAQARINNAYQIEDTFAWYVPGKRGDHDIKVGIQYQYSSQRFTNQGNLNGTFTFAGDAPFNPADPRTYPERLAIRVPGGNTFYQGGHNVSGFMQDKWRVNPRLTLSLGARYDLDINPLRAADNDLFSNPSDYPVDKNNIGPRVGFSYRLTSDDRTLLRGGYGTFYNSTRIGQVSGFITGGVFSDSFTANFPANAADAGPSNGRLPTDPLLAGGPTINAALVASLFPPGSRVKNTGTVQLDNPDRRTPYVHQASVGLERQLGTSLAVTADYIHSSTRGQLMTKDLNPGLRDTTARTSTLRRIDPRFTAAVNTQVNAGDTEYDALQLSVEKRMSHNFSTRVSYTLSYGRGNTTGAGDAAVSGFQLLDDLRLDLNQGPLDTDRRHNLVVSGTLQVPRTGGLTFSWIARALSGLPFTIVDSTTDPDRNGQFAEPLPSGSYFGTGDDSVTVDFDSKRNGARGPGFFQLDLRAGYRLRLGGVRTLDIFGEAFNATNRANFAVPTGDRRSTNFLRLVSLESGGLPTTGQIGVRLGF